MDKKIIFIGNQYTLLLLLILKIELKESLVICTGSITREHYLKLSNITTTFLFERKYSRFFWSELFYYYIENIKYFFWRRKNRKKISEVNCYLGSDHHYNILKNFYKKIESMTILEEGIFNYSSKNETIKYFKKNPRIFAIKRILLFQWGLKKYIPLGYSDKVSKIILSGIKETPDELRKKIEKVDMKKAWDNLSIFERNRINNFFGFVPDYYDCDSIVILTQPLSEDKLCSEGKKISIYKEIIKKYIKNNEKVIIKKHPREKTNYKEVFFDYKIDERNYPFELIDYNGIRIKKVITLFSTSAYNFKRSNEIIIVGTEEYREIYKKVGIYKYERRIQGK